jgi:hypothetical protein
VLLARAALEQPVSEMLSVEQIVNAYAAAFYRALNPALAVALTERLEARVQGIGGSRLATLYRVEFSEIQEPVYNWLIATYPDFEFSSHLEGLPGLTYDSNRLTTYKANENRHWAELGPQMPYPAAGWHEPALKMIELLYVLLEVFNHSDALTLREQGTLPASIATLMENSALKVPCLKQAGLPEFAQGVTPLDVYEACVEVDGKLVYPRSLWQRIEA